MDMGRHRLIFQQFLIKRTTRKVLKAMTSKLFLAWVWAQSAQELISSIQAFSLDQELITVLVQAVAIANKKSK
jgi:hypothetical protein